MADVKGSGLPIKMLHDRILVALRKEDGDRRSSGGILIPATAQVAKRLVWGEARGVGSSVRQVKVGDQVPPELLTLMDNVVVLVEDRNEDEPDLLGLYEGYALTERGWEYGGALPDRIMIYREAICDICSTAEEVVEEVTITVVHEIAHHFGIDDDRLHELGWS